MDRMISREIRSQEHTLHRGNVTMATKVNNPTQQGTGAKKPRPGADATKASIQSARQAATKECPGCQMPKEDWPNPKGYSKDGATYCCEGCAEGKDCNCEA
jgi:hypothetical protein